MTLVHLPSRPVVSKAKPTRGEALTTHVSPWLTPLAYTLGCHVVLPWHFSKIQLEGQENLPKEGPVILAPMHRSRWDALLLPWATGRKTTGRDINFMVTADEMAGIQGWVIRHLGGFPVNTTKPSSTSIRCGTEILRRGEMLAVFPEGDIFKDGAVHPLKAGLARMALQVAIEHQLNIRVVPIGLFYSDIETVPRGSEVRVVIDTPIQTDAYRDWPVKQAAQRLIADLQDALNRLS